MKFINKIFIVVFLQVFTTPNFSGAPFLVEGFLYFGLAISTLFFALFWEFADQMAELTAFNEMAENWVKTRAMDLLDWSSMKLYGEKVGSSTRSD